MSADLIDKLIFKIWELEVAAAGISQHRGIPADARESLRDAVDSLVAAQRQLLDAAPAGRAVK